MTGTSGGLVELFARPLRERATEVALVQHGAERESVTYGELDSRAQAFEDALRANGVKPGDRVGIALPKSIQSVASILGTLRAGAAYVPVGSGAPPRRNAFIFDDCGVASAVVPTGAAEGLIAELGREVRGTHELGDDALLLHLEPGAGEPVKDLAYILYTSGSTGAPKGVTITHENAASFVRWTHELLDLGPDDRFSSHAPFHFDLSIFDLYASLHAGGTLLLIGEEQGRQPRALAPLIAEERLTVWYSTPSILTLLVNHGHLDRIDASALRYVLFAGEVFPPKHLRALKALWPSPRYFNWYGPTETNVITSYEVPETVPEDRTDPYPIGKTCSHVRTRVLADGTKDAAPGEEGELVCAGASVTEGYWNLPDRTADALFEHAGERWYRTGDVVTEDAGGDYIFVGRRDRMVKRRGFRVELGEIEASLYRHPDVVEAAAVALPDEESGVAIVAFLCWTDGQHPSTIKLKRYCTENLPGYMIPDRFSHLDSLPKTSTDKVDYERLKGMA